MKNNTYYLHISGKNPCLSRAEAETLAKLIGGVLKAEFTHTLIYEFNCSEKEIANMQRRSSCIKEVGRLLGIAEQDPVEMGKVLLELKECFKKLFEGEERLLICIKRICSVGKHISSRDIASIFSRSFGVDPSKVIVRSKGCRGRYLSFIFTDGVVLIGYVISSEGKGRLLQDNPHNLPFYKPGVLNPWFSRLLVNLSLTRNSRVFHDLFCGVGGIVLQALDGVFREAFCFDVSRVMCWGALVNTSRLKPDSIVHIVMCDSTKPPLRSECVESLATDLPYGISVKTVSGSACDIAFKFLNELKNLLKRGGRAVVSMPAYCRVSEEELEGLRIVYKCNMYVHSRLGRTIMVVEK